MIDILINNQDLWIKGFATTISLIALIALIGIPMGIGVGVYAARYSNTTAGFIKKVSFCAKVLPLIVILFWIHYPMQALLNVVINPFITTVAALSLINAIRIAEITLAELSLMPSSYREAGMTLGLSNGAILQHIELPILSRRLLPQVLSVQAAMLEYTLLSSLISVPELFRTAQTINAMTYKPVEIYSMLIVFFFIILAPVHLFIQYFQRKHVIAYD